MGLAEKLAASLNRVVPDDVALAALPRGAIRIIAGHGPGYVEVDQWDPEPEPFAHEVLACLQDEVIENVTRTGWPPSDPEKPDARQHAGALPAPHAQVVEGQLLCWYGSRNNPALALPPISLNDD